MTAPLDEDIVELDGIKVPLTPGVVSPAILKALKMGKYEAARRKNLRAIVEGGDRIVDIGGGLGYTAAMMAQEGRASLVVAYEGHPAAHAAAELLHRLNGVTVDRRNALVVTENRHETRTIPFYLSTDFWGSSMLPISKGLDRIIEAPIVTVDEIIAEHAPTMLVFDLEVTKEYLAPGAASGPLESMSLSGVQKVVIHFSPRFEGGAKTVKRVFDFFSAQGFHYDCEQSRGSVVLFRRLPS